MDSQRNLLIIAFLFFSFIIWQKWEQDKNPQFHQRIQKKAETETNINNRHKISFNSQGKRITVQTDVLELIINTNGGDIEQALLLAYKEDLKFKKPFRLLETNSEFIYQAQSGLTGRDGPDNPSRGPRPLYEVDQYLFKLADNQNILIVPMVWTDNIGNTFTKTFTLRRGEYVIDVTYDIKNASNKPLEISIFGQLKQSIDSPYYRKISNNSFALQAFRGTAYSTSYEKYAKYKFENILNKENLNFSSKGGWIAMIQQYFATAWIPCKDKINNFYTTNLGEGIVAIGYKSNPILIQPGKIEKLKSILWVGPEIQDKMASVSPYLDLTVDYGWLWFISQPLFKLLKFMHNFFGNWGSSIVAITFIVRGIMYPLTKAQYTSIAKIRMLQPKIQEMRKRLSDDKQRQNQEMIALYKSEKVNPLGGCFPLIIQMPIFLALYYMLIGSVELRHAPFIFWIHDLSSQDPYYILPLLMGITMFFIQKTSKNTTIDPIQQKIMIFMPIIFTVFFLWFPSGLVLYYIVSNLVTIIQQKLIYRDLEKYGLYTKK